MNYSFNHSFSCQCWINYWTLCVINWSYCFWFSIIDFVNLSKNSNLWDFIMVFWLFACNLHAFAWYTAIPSNFGTTDTHHYNSILMFYLKHSVFYQRINNYLLTFGKDNWNIIFENFMMAVCIFLYLDFS